MVTYIGGTRRFRVLGGGRTTLFISPGLLRAPFVLTRAHTPSGASAHAVSASGVGLNAFGENVARFSGPGQRLLIEGARTNLCTRPGDPHNGITSFGGTGSWTFTGNAFAAPNGTMTMVRCQYTGGTGTGTIRIPTAALTDAVDHVASIYIRMVAQGGITALDFDVGDGSVTASVLAQVVNGQTVRVVAAPVASGLSDWLDMNFRNIASDVDCYVWGAQLEQVSETASTLIIPPTPPASSTRGADLITAPLTALALPTSGACTILATVMLPQNAGASAPQEIFRIDDGTENNRYRTFNAVSGGTIRTQRVTGGSAVNADAGSMTAGTPFRVGVAIDGAGRAACSLNGAAAVAVTGGPTSGLTMMRIGASVTGVEAMFGEIGALRVLPQVMSDAELAAAVAAF
jgi:hypothetical protein